MAEEDCFAKPGLAWPQSLFRCGLAFLPTQMRWDASCLLGRKWRASPGAIFPYAGLRHSCKPSRRYCDSDTMALAMTMLISWWDKNKHNQACRGFSWKPSWLQLRKPWVAAIFQAFRGCHLASPWWLSCCKPFMAVVLQACHGCRVASLSWLLSCTPFMAVALQAFHGCRLTSLSWLWYWNLSWPQSSNLSWLFLLHLLEKGFSITFSLHLFSSLPQQKSASHLTTATAKAKKIHPLSHKNLGAENTD